VTRFQGMAADSITWSVVRSEGPHRTPRRAGREGRKNAAAAVVKPRIPEKANWWNRKNLRSIGIGPMVSSVVAEVQADSPAARVRLAER